MSQPTSAAQAPLTHNEQRAIQRNITKLTIPNIISNITVPLLSIIDVGLAGHLSDQDAIGAVAIASGAINTLYWCFSFIRVGATGYVSQAFGRQDVKEINIQYLRGLLIALCVGALLIFAKPAVLLFARFMSQDVTTLASMAGQYLNIMLMGAPAAMMVYHFNGWFSGMQNARIPMFIAIVTNLLNIAASFLLVEYTSLGVAALALGTIMAQYVGVIIFFCAAHVRFRRVLQFAKLKYALVRKGLGHYFLTGKDIFIRALLLSIVTLYFTYASVGQGVTVVAANTLLLQFFSLFSYFTDGFAYAGESLTGRYIGMQSSKRLTFLVKRLFVIGLILALLCAALYAIFPKAILSLLSNNSTIIAEALRYKWWVALVPIAGFATFLWDGIFVGATYSKGLLWSMIVACAGFFAIYWSTRALLNNDALWLAFNCYLALRGMVQLFMWKRHVPRLC